MADAAAAGGSTAQAGEIGKGSYLMIKGRPCECVEASKTKNEEKALIVAIDIFTGKKMEHVCPVSDNLEVPLVTRITYEVLDADEEAGFVTLMQEDGESKELTLPEDENLKEELLAELGKGGQFFAIVYAACGEEKIVKIKCE